MSFRDIFRIGNTPLNHVPGLNQTFGIPANIEVLVKDESANKFGTFKDRRNLTVAEQLGQRKATHYAACTSGNDGYSRGKIFQKVLPEKTVVNLVDKDISPWIREKLEEVSTVMDVDMSKMVYVRGEVTERLGIDNKFLCEGFDFLDNIYNNVHGYTKLIEEIIDQVKPYCIILPVGSGELFWYASYRAKKRINIIGVTVDKANPYALVRSLDDYNRYNRLRGITMPPFFNSDSPQSGIESNPMDEKEKRICDFRTDFNTCADKLTAHYLPHVPYVLHLINEQDKRRRIIAIGDEEIKSAYFKCQELGIRAEPSAAAAFAVLPHLRDHGYQPNKNSKIVVINTGEGLYDKPV